MPDDEITDGAKDLAAGAAAVGVAVTAVAPGTAAAGAVAATAPSTLGAIAAGGGVAGVGVAGAAVVGAAAGGALIGVGIEHVTGGAISDGIGHGLLDVVGDDESHKAVVAFDDGDILGGLGHMASGIGDSISHAFGGDDAAVAPEGVPEDYQQEY